MSTLPISIFRATRLLLLCLSFFAAAGCSITKLGKKELTPVSGDSLQLRQLTEQENSGDLGMKEQFPEYSRAAASPQTRVFLIAGGADTPNYLQEIVDQRDYLLQAGHGASEIACFYVKPSPEEYAAHADRFEQLASRVDGFYLAAPHLIYRHLRAAAQAKPNFVYIYATAKGHKPIWMKKAKGAERELAKHHAEYFGQFRMELAGGPSGHMNARMRLEALRDGIEIQHLLFTPRYLREALGDFPEETRKIVVLQGSYSGGFVRHEFEELTSDNLTAVPNATVLASSRHDREGFRGAMGDFHSHFGQIYLDALHDQSEPAGNLDWSIIAEKVASGVRERETELSIGPDSASSPVFYSDVAPEMVAEASFLPADEDETAVSLEESPILEDSAELTDSADSAGLAD